MTEAEKCKEEVHKEYVKRCSAEKELLLANHRVGLLERSLARKSNIRVEIEAKYSREKTESENLRNELDEVSRELQVTRQKLELDANFKELELRLSDAENILISLQKERDLLHEERNQLQKDLDDAVCQVEILQNRRMDKGRSNLRVYHMSEFSHLELVEATDNFKSALRIGEGGYGIVYKGFLRQTTVAIKKLHPQSMQGHLEFHTEVTILSRVRHPNLVTLIGACEEANALIYEFLPCGSLEDHLPCKGNDPSLSWQARIRICAEICSALIFLHSARPQSVVHGDLKLANILLDANLVSKLSDFGLICLLTQSPASSTFGHQTDPKGTFCYMDPSFLSSGELTPSSDVYSFGIIVLQLLTAKQPFQIARDMQMALENNTLHEILDKSAGDWPFVQAQQLAHLGIRCCAIDRKSRPDLVKEVWRILEPMKKAAIGPSLYSRKMDENHNVPSYFICPIFQEIMSDPHVAADGYTYEVEAIRGWLQSGHATSPMTNLKLENEKLTPNHALRSAIQEWSQQRRYT